MRRYFERNCSKINEDFSHSTIALKLNVTDEEEWKKVVEECINQFGTVDILLNNAGIGSKVLIMIRQIIKRLKM